VSDIDLRDDGDQPTAEERKETGALEAFRSFFSSTKMAIGLLLKAFWSFFSSMKTAIGLLLLLALVSVLGTVLEDKRGAIIYHTPWFSAMLAMVGVNLAVCSINRFGLAWKRTFSPNVETDAKAVARMSVSEEVESACSADLAAQKLVSALRQCSYKPLSQSDEDTVSIYASKGWAAIWGPYLTHLSILVIFIGAIFGGIVGTDGGVIIVEGERVNGYFPSKSNTSKPLGFEVALRKFEIKHDGKGNPTAYRSDLQIYDEGKPVAQKIIDVNHPLSYKGMTFYQSDYGLAGLTIKVTTADGGVARIPFEIGVEDRGGAKIYQIAEEPFKTFTLDGKKWTLFVHDLVPDYVGGSELNRSLLPVNVAVNVMLNDRFPEYKGLDAWRKIGWVPVSQSVKHQDLTITLDNVVSYTGLQVARNPGLPAIYAGFILMVLGLFMSFYVTRKTIRISISGAADGSKVAIGATSRAEPSIFEKDFKRLRESIS
jgi:cytochrome c biogenesis protein